MDRILERAARLVRCNASRALGALALVVAVVVSGAAMAAQPEPWQLNLQPKVTPVGEKIGQLHDILLVIITLISVFVLALLAYVCIRFRRSANPTPSKTTHNSVLEIAWTGVPALILVFIGLFSFPLLYFQDKAVDPDMTVKVTSHQWYWNYEYTDEELTFDSYMIPEEDLQPGQPRLLEVDNRMVVPVGASVQVLVDTGDVMHSFFMPALGVQVYGTPGRINETWFQIDKVGVYYGQCNQICGLNHAYMPIVVEAMEQADYDAWLEKAKVEFAMNPNATPNATAVASVAD